MSPEETASEITTTCGGSLLYARTEITKAIRAAWGGTPVPAGVRYVVGTPPGTPILRPLKQPMYDRLVVEPNGLLYGYVADVDLFSNCRVFPDGQSKCDTDTNMTQNGQLGCPLEFDFSWVEFRIESYSNPEDVRTVLKHLSSQWIFGSSVVWFKGPLTVWKPLVGNNPFEPVPEDVMENYVMDLDRKGLWPIYYQPMTTPDGLPRRIVSTERFRLRLYIDPRCPPLSGPVSILFLMQDTLYSQL